jgi:hypothetical protein
LYLSKMHGRTTININYYINYPRLFVIYNWYITSHHGGLTVTFFFNYPDWPHSTTDATAETSVRPASENHSSNQ